MAEEAGEKTFFLRCGRLEENLAQEVHGLGQLRVRLACTFLVNETYTFL